MRVCPTDAIAVAGEEPLLLQSWTRPASGAAQCLPACPHDAVKVNGELGTGARHRRRRATAVLILSPESVAHFYPATPEQVINACYAAGFRVVTRGVIGDELVAAEYLKLWEDEPWGTTDPLHRPGGGGDGADAVSRAGALPRAGDDAAGGGGAIPARAVRRRAQVVYAGHVARRSSTELDAAITFGDLEQLLPHPGRDVR